MACDKEAIHSSGKVTINCRFNNNKPNRSTITSEAVGQELKVDLAKWLSAADVLSGDMPLTHWKSGPSGFLLDVRHPEGLAIEQAPGAVNIPLGELRERLDELPRDQEIQIICRSGQRAYYATRILMQNGFNARILSGGMLSRTILSGD